MDVCVGRQNNGQLTTKVYRKPTHTERYLSFDSHHPILHKKAVVRSLTDRARSIPSSSQERSREMKHVMSILEDNGYPKHFIIEASKPKKSSEEMSNSTSVNDESGNKFCVLPYIQGTSEPIKRILEQFGMKGIKASPNHWKSVPKAERPCAKSSDPCADL